MPMSGFDATKRAAADHADVVIPRADQSTISARPARSTSSRPPASRASNCTARARTGTMLGIFRSTASDRLLALFHTGIAFHIEEPAYVDGADAFSCSTRSPCVSGFDHPGRASRQSVGARRAAKPRAGAGGCISTSPDRRSSRRPRTSQSSRTTCGGRPTAHSSPHAVVMRSRSSCSEPTRRLSNSRTCWVDTRPCSTRARCPRRAAGKSTARRSAVHIAVHLMSRPIRHPRYYRRSPVFLDRHQLHRSPDPERAGADPQGPVSLDELRFRADRHRLPLRTRSARQPADAFSTGWARAGA